MANVKDGATGTVLTAPSPATSGLSLTLNSGEGARFPTAPFYVIAHPNNTIPTVSTAEKLLVTAVSTDTFTIVRAQGIYSAQSIAVGYRISNAIFQDDMNNASIIRNEVPGGSVNGSNTAFTTASAAAMATASLEVYKNGVRMKPGGADFTQTTTGFTMVTAPASGTVLLCDYIVAGALNNVGTNSLVTVETPTGLVNGSNTSYTTARAYIGGSLEVYLNGLKQARGTDYTETTPGSGIFTMATAPPTGYTIFVDYQFNLNPASNADTVDGIHANTTPIANTLLALDSNATIPQTVVQTGVLAYVPLITSFSGSGAATQQVTGLTATVTIPTLPTGGRIRVTAQATVISGTGGDVFSIWDGTVGSGTQLNQVNGQTGNGSLVQAITNPAAGSKTYNVGVSCGSGTVGISAGATIPAFLLVEII